MSVMRKRSSNSTITLASRSAAIAGGREDRRCEGFRMPAVRGRLPSGGDGAGIRNPSQQQT